MGLSYNKFFKSYSLFFFIMITTAVLTRVENFSLLDFTRSWPGVRTTANSHPPSLNNPKFLYF